ncbi:hypothetical protein SALBM217S_00201 [Streptomyces griseoloalbus]
MPDRSLRLLTFPQQSAQGGERGAVLLRGSARPHLPTPRRARAATTAAGAPGTARTTTRSRPRRRARPTAPGSPAIRRAARARAATAPRGRATGATGGPAAPRRLRRAPARPGRAGRRRPAGSGRALGPHGPGPAPRAVRPAGRRWCGVLLRPCSHWTVPGAAAGRATPCTGASAPCAPSPAGRTRDTPAPRAEGPPADHGGGKPARRSWPAWHCSCVAGAFGARLIYSDYYECTSDSPHATGPPVVRRPSAGAVAGRAGRGGLTAHRTPPGTPSPNPVLPALRGRTGSVLTRGRGRRAFWGAGARRFRGASASGRSGGAGDRRLRGCGRLRLL